MRQGRSLPACWRQLAMLLVRAASKLREDAVMGVVFTAFFAIGMLIVAVNPTSVNVQSIVLGNILAISPGDALQVAGIAVVALLVIAVLWRQLMLVFFDEAHALSLGMKTLPLKLVFFMILSAAIVAALQAVGAVLVVAMVIAPGATAYLLTDRFGRPLAHGVVHRHGDGGARSLSELFPRWRDRGAHRDAAGGDLPCGLRLRAEAWHADGAPRHCTDRGCSMS